MFPPIPAWDALHPLIVHFPIALLIVAPILVVIGLFFRVHAPGWFGAALVVMLLGTIAAYVAIETGEDAAELVTRTGGIPAVLERHQDLAETTRTVFTILTVAFAALAFGPSLLKKHLALFVFRIAVTVFLLVYLGGMVLLANTAHAGGRLVHEFGVRAAISASAEPAAAQPDHDDD